jgi:hypothetical protein
MFSTLKNKLRYAARYLAYLYSTDIKAPDLKEGDTRSYFLAWVIETSLGSLFFFVLFGTVAAPQFYAVSTAGWNTYAALIWVMTPLICIAGFAIRVIKSAQSGYLGPISGSPW